MVSVMVVLRASGVSLETSLFRAAYEPLYAPLPVSQKRATKPARRRTWRMAPWEAVLGTNVTIPALDGPVTVRILPGTNNGQQLRVRGKGLPAAGGTRGDLYAVITIQTPTEVTSAERELWQQLAQRSAFNPRKAV